jgi:hypothetical protein
VEISTDPQNDILPLQQSFKDLLFGSIVSIMGHHSGSVCQWGTGTLFAIGDSSFLITAAHVITDARKYQVSMFIGDKAQSAPAISLADCKAYPLGGHHDVGVIELRDHIVESIPHRVFLRLNDVAYSATPIPGRFLLWGYPKYLSVPVDPSCLAAMPIAVLTELSDDTDNLDRFSPDVHYLFPIPDKNSRGSCDERPPAPGELGGISGCSIWRVDATKTDGHWNPIPKGKIVAVQTCVYEKRHLARATLWAYVARAFWEKYENLRPAIQMHVPPDWLHFVTGG